MRCNHCGKRKDAIFNKCRCRNGSGSPSSAIRRDDDYTSHSVATSTGFLGGMFSGGSDSCSGSSGGDFGGGGFCD